jgi:hypothetical protein
MRGLIVLALALLAASEGAQSFSCNLGKQPSCLSYSDMVVDRSSQCFDQMTCFPGGFVCKSDMDDLRNKAKRIASNYDDLRLCLSRASDMTDVQSCVRSDLINQ